MIRSGITLRPETESDRRQVHAVQSAAFPTDAEARLVDRLRLEADPVVSVVAVEDATVLGHILFSPVTLDTAGSALVMGLAPMAVRPDRQRQGIGSELVRYGLERCRELGAVAVVVLGHPEYYPRFGFKPASGFGVRSEYDVPDDAFMLLELEAGTVSPGVVRYHCAFDTL